jgi:hypothetical protein
MTKNTWMYVPAGVLGQGGADARPYPGVAVRPLTVAPRVALPGTGVPTARLRDLAGTTCTPRGEFIAQRFVAKHSAQNDGTTLGFHTSSRPLS